MKVVEGSDFVTISAINKSWSRINIDQGTEQTPCFGPAFESTRSQYLISIFEKHPNLAFCSPAQQVSFLYFNEHLCDEILDTSSQMLSELNAYRQKLISLREGIWRCEMTQPLILKFTRV